MIGVKAHMRAGPTRPHAWLPSQGENTGQDLLGVGWVAGQAETAWDNRAWLLSLPH